MSPFLEKNKKQRVVLLAVTASVLLSICFRYLGNNSKSLSRSVEITYKFTINDILANTKQIQAWIPLPPTNKHQILHSLEVVGNWPYKITREPEYSNQFMLFDLSEVPLHNTNNVQLSIKFKVTRYTIHSLPQKGWLPIDASEANKFPEKKEMFFAGLDENRVAFTIGRDIKLPGSNTEPLNFSIYPHVEINGEVYNNVETEFLFKDVR